MPLKVRKEIHQESKSDPEFELEITYLFHFGKHIQGFTPGDPFAFMEQIFLSQIW
jgi:hypothetical protein